MAQPEISIYFLADATRPRKVMYVGQTVESLEHRMERHYRDARAGKPLPRNVWIRSIFRHGSGLVIRLIETARSKREANRKEEKWIRFYWDRGLKNVSRKAIGVERHSRAAKRKMARAKRGKRLSLSHRKRISAALRRVWKTEAMRNAQHQGMLGHKTTAKARRNMSMAAKGRTISPKQKIKIAKGLREWYRLHPQTKERRRRASRAIRRAWSDPKLKREQAERVRVRHRDPEYRKRFCKAAALAWKKRKEGV